MESNEKLEAMREEMGITRTAWADMLGITLGAYRRYVIGTRQPNKTIMKLAALIYGVYRKTPKPKL